jgi:hypothetical protein
MSWIMSQFDFLQAATEAIDDWQHVDENSAERDPDLLDIDEIAYSPPCASSSNSRKLLDKKTEHVVRQKNYKKQLKKSKKAADPIRASNRKKKLDRKHRMAAEAFAAAYSHATAKHSKSCFIGAHESANPTSTVEYYLKKGYRYIKFDGYTSSTSCYVSCIKTDSLGFDFFQQNDCDC